MRLIPVLLLTLCGCSTAVIATDCIPVKPWSRAEQLSVESTVRQSNNPTIEAFLEDYGRMRDQARQQSCNQ